MDYGVRENAEKVMQTLNEFRPVSGIQRAGEAKRGQPAAFRYAVAAVCVLAALAADFILAPVLRGRSPLILFVGSAMAAGWYGGLGPGVVALLAGLVLGDMFFLPPFGPNNSSDMALMAVYAAVGCLGLAAITNWHRAKNREERVNLVAEKLEQEVVEHRKAEEASRVAKERLDFALSAARLCTWNLDLRTREMELTCNHERLLGPERDGFAGSFDHFLANVHPDDRGILNRLLEGNLDEEKRCELEFRIAWADGSMHWLLCKGRVLRDGSSERPGRMNGILMEVTERKRAENEFQEAFSLLQTTLEATADGILVVDLTGAVASYNRKFAAMWQIPEELVEFKDDRRLLAYVERQLCEPEAFLRRVQELIQHKEGESRDELKFKDGRVFERYSQPHRVGDRIVGRVWSFRDVTEARRAEEALRQSEARYRALADATFDAVVIHENGIALDVNRGITEMFGYKREELIGRSGVIEMVVEEESRANVLHHMHSGSTEAYEAKVRRKDGTRFLVELRARNFEYEGRTVRVASVHDITARKRAEEELRRSEERMRLLMDEAKDYAILMLDIEGRVVGWNGGARHLKGYESGEILGRHYSRFYPPEEAQRNKPTLDLNKAAAEGRFQDEGWRVRKDGSRFWASVVITALHDKTGKLVGFSKLVRDITEQKLAREQLAASERFIRSALNALGSHIAILDSGGTILEVNRAWRDFAQTNHLGMDLYGVGGNYLFVCDRAHGWEAGYARAAAAGIRAVARGERDYFYMEYPCHSPREDQWFILRVSRFDGDNYVRLVVSHQNVTEMKQAQEASRKSEERLHELADAMPQIVWTMEPSGKMEYVNKKWFEYSGLSVETALTSEAWKMVAHPNDEERAKAAMRAALESGRSLQIETRIKDKNDGYRWHLTRAVPMQDETGRIVRWFGTSTDIEDQKHTQEDLLKAKEQLGHYAQNLESRVAERTMKLEETIRSLEGVLYHVAHDLRAPLRTMSAFTEMLVEAAGGHLDETGKDSATRIIAAAKRMDQLILDLLAYGRLSHLRMSFSRVPLTRVVESVLYEIAGEIQARGAEVEVVKPLPAVWADAAVVRKVLPPLVRNALTFTAPNVTPRIRIRGEKRAGSVRLWVEDNGIGIDREHWGRIFRVFERLHRTDEYPGTGIGLAIVFKGMERLGGSTGVESKHGEGSRFWLEFPGGPDQE